MAAYDPTLLQREFAVCCEWSLPAVDVAAPTCDVVVIVDVVSFQGSVEIGTELDVSANAPMLQAGTYVAVAS